jgi:hypothetical protein
MRRILLALGFAAASLAPLASADVLVVGPPSLGGTHATIQSAVDAAAEGDVILVAADSPGFTIDGKGLSVVGWPDLEVEVQGTIRVLDLPAGSTVLLDQLSVRGASVFPEAAPALVLSSNSGQVRVHSCTLNGGLGTGFSGCVAGSGGDAVVIDASMGVVLKDCDLLGGKAAEVGSEACEGTRGGDGLRISSSVVALYGGTAVGGHGGQADGIPGDGGDGVHVLSWGVFAAGTLIAGGHCGYNPHGFGNGDGGDGLLLAAARGVRPRPARGSSRTCRETISRCGWDPWRPTATGSTWTWTPNPAPRSGSSCRSTRRCATCRAGRASRPSRPPRR